MSGSAASEFASEADESEPSDEYVNKPKRESSRVAVSPSGITDVFDQVSGQGSFSKSCARASVECSVCLSSFDSYNHTPLPLLYISPLNYQPSYQYCRL